MIVKCLLILTWLLMMLTLLFQVSVYYFGMYYVFDLNEMSMLLLSPLLIFYVFYVIRGGNAHKIGVISTVVANVFMYAFLSYASHTYEADFSKKLSIVKENVETLCNSGTCPQTISGWKVEYENDLIHSRYVGNIYRMKYFIRYIYDKTDHSYQIVYSHSYDKGGSYSGQEEKHSDIKRSHSSPAQSMAL